MTTVITGWVTPVMWLWSWTAVLAAFVVIYAAWAYRERA
jgi:hypothetical protein